MSKTVPAPRRPAAGRFVYLFASALAGVSVLTGVKASAAESVAEIPGSLQRSTDTDTGEFSSANMTVEIVLAPSHASDLSALLSNLYNSQSASYQQWLGRGEFTARFAPSNAEVAAVTAYLQGKGLTVAQTASPFLLRVSGSSPQLTAALNTSLHNYRNPNGVTYFANASAVSLPASLASGVLGVVGMTNTVRVLSHVALPNAFSAPKPSCEAPYATAEELAAAILDGTPYPFGYGGSPGCNGLTPSQVNSIYSSPHLGPIAQGLGVNLAVFELSAYQHSDIEQWAQTFYGQSVTPPLVDVTVDGGPLTPKCPAGDECPPNINGYSGDLEVAADIEMSLAISPAASHIYVYNAPNDYTGQTELDEYTKIANDDLADTVSSSWAVCENDNPPGYIEAENLVFEQMAAQGQSMFGVAGDTGAFSCIRSDGTTIVNVLDPAAQPWVTSVGGTSLESFNPNANPNPSYPQGIETVWNFRNLCNTSASELGIAGLDWCALTGAGGGGSSQYWGRPFYQSGPGVDNPYTTYGNGTTHCSLAAVGTPCRELPDVSLNADPYTPYAMYCTGNASTPYSECAQFAPYDTPPGWIALGGTSLSSPIWAATIANRVALWHRRVGNANPLLYALFRSDYHGYFHDITGKGQTTNNNGLFPTTPGYDLATGIGTPKMDAVITGFPDQDQQGQQGQQ